MTETYAVDFDLPKDAADLIPRNRAVLWVSVGGGRDFEGGRFDRLARWALENFHEVWIDLADTDKAINLRTFNGYSKRDAYNSTRETGDIWKAANHEVVDLVKKGNLIRFDHWAKSQEYGAFRKVIGDLYQNDETFKFAVDIEAAGYAAKRVTQPLPHHHEGCVTYILNEIAACCVRAKELQAVCIYPGQQKEPFRLIRSGEIAGAPPELGLEPYAPVAVWRSHKKRRLIAAPSADVPMDAPAYAELGMK